MYVIYRSNVKVVYSKYIYPRIFGGVRGNRDIVYLGRKKCFYVQKCLLRIMYYFNQEERIGSIKLAFCILHFFVSLFFI
jgi:hypothetical protein